MRVCVSVCCSGPPALPASCHPVLWCRVPLPRRDVRFTTTTVDGNDQTTVSISTKTKVCVRFVMSSKRPVDVL